MNFYDKDGLLYETIADDVVTSTIIANEINSDTMIREIRLTKKAVASV